MMNFFKGGRGMAYGQSDEVTKLPSDKPSCPINNKNIRYSVQNSGEAGAPSVYKLILFLVVCLFTNAALAQSHSPSEAAAEAVSPLMVGQKVPESFWKQEHLFYLNGDTIRKTLEEHKGKMLVLDFWFSGCTKCMLHQKEISYYKKKYPDHLAVVMVNTVQSREDYAKLKVYFESERFKRLGLTDFTSIVEDRYLLSMFPQTGYPRYLWINDIGVLQLDTFRNLLDRDYKTPFIDVKR